MKITKKRLFDFCNENNDALNDLQSQSDSTDFVLSTLIDQLKDLGVIDKLGDEPSEPKLKQLDQSVFNHPYVDDRFNYVALNADGQSIFFEQKPSVSVNLDIWVATGGSILPMLKGCDATDWQNSLIERDTAKELLEVDLSSELTGSELCKAMLARGDKYVLCQCWDSSYADIEQVVDVINGFECTAYKKLFAGNRHNWEYAVPINNQGEPLTASEVGL